MSDTPIPDATLRILAATKGGGMLARIARELLDVRQRVRELDVQLCAADDRVREKEQRCV